ncbi:hypothetical protein AVEN_13014-1 [Araneus ventricosus]|uniref:Uncharacterized protein n=1 Tax=Araneus ventricosus TaxID=182803 RepID=A0A4Y2HMI0_ARAVE|nr:hypothetical protein AVEN_13014-1 [Araneus ventricosus]
MRSTSDLLVFHRMQSCVSQEERGSRRHHCLQPEPADNEKLYAKQVVGVLTSIQDKNVLVVSVYCLPKEEINTILLELENCLHLPHDSSHLRGFQLQEPGLGRSTKEDVSCWNSS